MFVSSEKDLSAISTNFAFTVESVLSDPKGKVSKVGSTLVVHQTGGKNGRVTQLVIGGPTGRFTVSHTDEVNSFSGGGMN